MTQDVSKFISTSIFFLPLQHTSADHLEAEGEYRYMMSAPPSSRFAIGGCIVEVCDAIQFFHLPLG